MGKRILYIGSLNKVMISVIEELLSQQFEVCIIQDKILNPNELPSLLSILPEDCVLSHLDYVLINSYEKLSKKDGKFMLQLNKLRLASIKKVFILQPLWKENNKRIISRVKKLNGNIVVFKASLFFERLVELTLTRFFRTYFELSRGHYWVSAKDFARQLTEAIKCPVKGDCEFFVQGPERLGLGEFISKVDEAQEQLRPANSIHFNLKRATTLMKRLLIFRPGLIKGKEEDFRAGQTWETFGKPQICFNCFLRMTA